MFFTLLPLHEVLAHLVFSSQINKRRPKWYLFFLKSCNQHLMRGYSHSMCKAQAGGTAPWCGFVLILLEEMAMEIGCVFPQCYLGFLVCTLVYCFLPTEAQIFLSDDDSVCTCLSSIHTSKSEISFSLCTKASLDPRVSSDSSALACQVARGA